MTKTSPNKPTKQTLHRLYWDEHLSLRTLGERFDVDGATVRNWMISYDIPRRDLSPGVKRSKHHSQAISEAQKRLITEGKRRYDGKYNPSWKGGPVTVECGWCGEPVEVPRTYLKQVKTTFCKGTDCRSKWMSKTIPERRYNKPHYGSQVLTCEQCGTSFRRPNGRDKGQKHVFCSAKCKKLWFRGDKVYNFKGGYEPYYGKNWRTQRRKARKRDNYTCQKCGIHQSELDRALDVHHIISFGEFGIERYKEANDLSNLMSLCGSCHSQETANGFHQTSS